MREHVINIELSVPQHEYYWSTAKNVAAVAGVGSGKTETEMFRQVSTMFQYPGAHMGYFAPTVALIKDIFYPKITDYLDRIKVRHRILEQKNIVKIYGKGNIYCRTMDNPDNIVGFEILDAFIDEFDILKKEKAIRAYQKIKARCRQKVRNNPSQRKFWKAAGYKGKHKPSQLFTATTPEGFKAAYHLFKKNPFPSTHLIQMSTYSNIHNLPDDYIQDLLQTYPPQLIAAYLLGQFVNLVSLPVWLNYCNIKNNCKHIVEGSEPIHVGMDFNIGRGCAVIHVERDGYLAAVDEIVNTYQTTDTIRILKDRYVNNPIITYPDSSGKNRKSSASISDIALLKNEGFLVKARSKQPRVKDRINSANAMFLNALGQRRYLVNEEKCPYYSDGLLQQIYDDNGVPEKGKDKFDDITDAGTYPIEFLYPIKKTNVLRSDLPF